MRYGPLAAWTTRRRPLPATSYGSGSGPRAAEAHASTARAGSGFPPVGAVIALARPRQWVKNGLVAAAAGAAGALGHDGVPIRITLACLAFCLLASGTYAINDVRDADEDRLHPRKRHRPVASGAIDPAVAMLIGAGLIVAGLLLCWLVRPLLTIVGAGYMTLTLSYAFLWRSVPVVDVLAISGGFVLRAVAGGVAAPVTLSRWFVLVVSATAVFLASAKRHSELQRTSAGGTIRRRVLERYPVGLLELMMLAAAGISIFAYCVWAFMPPSVGGSVWRVMSIAPFLGCLCRYGLRIRGGTAETPEDVLFKDRLIQVSALAWLVLFALAVNAAY